MKIDILTLFPSMFDGILNHSRLKDMDRIQINNNQWEEVFEYEKNGNK